MTFQYMYVTFKVLTDSLNQLFLVFRDVFRDVSCFQRCLESGSEEVAVMMQATGKPYNHLDHVPYALNAW